MFAILFQVLLIEIQQEIFAGFVNKLAFPKMGSIGSIARAGGDVGGLWSLLAIDKMNSEYVWSASSLQHQHQMGGITSSCTTMTAGHWSSRICTHVEHHLWEENNERTDKVHVWERL